MTRKLLTLLSALLLFLQVQGQDIHFSQFFNMPALVNPASTGFFNGNYRFNAIYRSQWKSVTVPYQTGMVSAELSLGAGHRRTNVSGLGLLVGSDKAGDSRFTTSKVLLSYAYHVGLGNFGKQHISMGIQTGMNSSYIDYTHLKFDEEFLGGNTNENDNFNSAHYFDLNMGMEYTYTQYKANQYFFGASIYHVNQPSYTFMNNLESHMFRRYQVNAGADIKLGRSYQLYPRAYVASEGPLKELVFGSLACFDLKPTTHQDTRFYLGTFLRWNDAFITMLRCDIQNFTMSFSYDFTVSSLSNTNYSMGGPELALSYRGFLPNAKHKSVYCPRF